MNLCSTRKEIHASQINHFEKILHYKYRCDRVKAGIKCQITVEIKNEPTSIEINNYIYEEYLPSGIYHLNRVSCSCSYFSKLSRKIEILFRKKVGEINCRLHNKEFDVYLRSNRPLSFKKI